MSARVLVVGAGAIGGVTAARLTRAGVEVSVLDANAEHVRLMRSPGLRFDELGSESYVRIDAVAGPEQLTGRFDFALVTLKAPFLETALAPLVRHDRVDTYVSLGNGLVQDAVEAVVGADRFLVGVTEWGATNLGPGHLAQTTVAPFVVGEADGRRSERVQRLAGVLSAAAETVVSEGILGQVWTKLLLNSTFSGLGAVSGLLYGEIAAREDGRTVAHRLWTEGYHVARAAGVPLDSLLGVPPEALTVRQGVAEEAASAALAELMSHLAATKASMLQDLERGAATEVDVINGGVAATARRLGVTAPLNSRVVEIVHAFERGEGRPDPAVLAELLALPAGAGC
jgi:2-dehydropantoate 2-reductase